MSRIAVIGAGASGLAAAVAAAECGADVTVFEASPRAGRPILATGNGRCNLTNTHIARSPSPAVSPSQPAVSPSPAVSPLPGISPETASAYSAPSFVAPALAAHDCTELREWFWRLGLATVVDTGGMDGGGGRVYPLSRTAQTVVDVLLAACDRLGARIVCDRRIESIAPGSGIWTDFDAVIACTGGTSRLLETAGHTFAPQVPVLCPLATDTAPIRGLSGVRVRAQVTVRPSRESAEPRSSAAPKFSEPGEVLFRDYGVSGVVIFDASRYVQAGDILELDLLPSVGERELADALVDRARRLGPKPTAEEVLRGLWHERVCQAILRAADDDEHTYDESAYDESAYGESARDARVARTAYVAKHFRLRVEGPADTRHAQVTRGGAKLSEFDPQTMESRLVPHLHAAGETLDVDARCGGYNLHWAWSSARQAAEYATSA